MLVCGTIFVSINFYCFVGGGAVDFSPFPALSVGKYVHCGACSFLIGISILLFALHRVSHVALLFLVIVVLSLETFLTLLVLCLVGLLSIPFQLLAMLLWFSLHVFRVISAALLMWLLLKVLW